MKSKNFHLFKINILLVFVFLTTGLNAQDTTILHHIDTVATVIEPPPIEETVTIEEAKEEDDDDDPSYFTFKNAEGGGLPSPQFRKLDDTLVNKLRNDEDFWYANAVLDKKKEEKPKGSSGGGSSSGAWQNLLWILIIGGFITFLVIYLSNSNVGIFRKSRSIAEAESEEETEDIFAINYQKEIDKAVGAGNYRLAVRLHFLRLLRSLSEKNLIRYAVDRTNFDYLMQVSQASWYQQFFRITRNYEYVWYGQFDIDNEKYDMIRKEFVNLDQQLQY